MKLTTTHRQVLRALTEAPRRYLHRGRAGVYVVKDENSPRELSPRIRTQTVARLIDEGLIDVRASRATAEAHRRFGPGAVK